MTVRGTSKPAAAAFLLAALLLPVAPAEELPRLGIGSPIEAALGDPDPKLAGKGRHRLFLLEADAPGRVTIRLESRQFDAYLLVKDSEGATVAEDEDGGPGDGAQASFVAEAGRTYRVLAASQREEGSGRFLLEAREGEPEKPSPGQELVRDLAWYQETEKGELTLGRKGQVLNKIGQCQLDLGSPVQAIEAWNEALEVVRRTEDRTAEGRLLGNLGVAYKNLGQSVKAVELFLKALEIHRETGNRRNEGIELMNLGTAYRLLGQTEKAIESYEKALEIHRETKSLRSEGLTQANLGVAYAGLGQPAKAIEHYQNALEILRKTNDRRSEGLLLGSLGNVYRDLGQPEKAIDHYQKCLEINRETKDLRSEGLTLGNLGLVYSELDQPERAIAHQEMSLEILRRVNDRINEGRTLSDLANVYRDLGQLERAMVYQEKALAIHRETNDRRGEGVLLGNLGLAFRDQGQRERAREYLGKALQISRETRNRLQEALMLWYLAGVHFQGGADALAHQTFRSAYAIDRDILESVARGLEDSALQSFSSETFKRGVADYFDLLAKLFRNAGSPEEREGLLEEALDLVEGFRARVFSRSLRSGDLRGVLSPEGRAAWNRLGALRGQIDDLVKSTFQQLPAEGKLRDEAMAKLREACRLREEEIASLERKLKSTERHFASLLPGPRLTRAQVSKVLAGDEVLLHYNVLGKKVAVFVVDARGGLGLEMLGVDAERLRGEVEEALAEIRSRGGKPGAPSKLKERLGTLREELFGGLKDRLDRAGGILVVPDGFLHLFPFEALVLEDGRYVVEKLRVRYAPSIQVLIDLEIRERRSGPSKLVLFGDPDFGKPPPGPGESAVAMHLRGVSGFPHLEHAGEEVEAVAALFDQKLLRRGSEATEARFKAECHQGSFLHLATHGRFAQVADADGRALFYSGLAFSGLNRGGDGSEDGFLTAAEVLALDLGAVDLAVLSACETAAGAVRPHEGKFGLERAFFIAGVRSFLGSLWQVDDRATAELMARFYRALREGKSKPEALRQAKLAFILRGGGTRAGQAAGGQRGVGLAPEAYRDLAHPYYWAPFVFSGVE